MTRLAGSALALTLAAAALLFGGGSGSSRLLWLGGAALLLAALAYALLGSQRPGGAGLALLAALAGLALWSGLSIVWSVAPDSSWTATNRVLVYLGFACLGFVLAIPARRLAFGVAAALAATIGWALLTKVFPGLYADYGRIARLRSPVGYWNALAQAGDALLPLGLWLLARRRAEGAVLAYAAVVAIVLTFSRSGIAFAAVAVVLYLALAGRAAEGVLGLACSLVPAGVVLGVSAALPGIVKDGQSRDVRAHDGWLFAIALVLGAAAAWALGRWAARAELAPRPGAGSSAAPPSSERRPPSRGSRSWRCTRAGPRSCSTSSRTRRASRSSRRAAGSGAPTRPIAGTGGRSRGRPSREHPLEGSGAGSFPIEHRLVRTTFSQPAEEPHSLPLQFLGETGIVGFLLLAALVAAGAAILRSALRLADDRAAVAALAAGCAAYALHTLVDLHWDYLAVSAPVFLSLGALAAPGAVAVRRPRLGAAAALLLAATAVYSLASPYLANRKLDEWSAAVDRGDLAAAYDSARSARSLNPLSIDPLLRQGAVAPTFREREALYVKAVKLQPDNPDAWVALGELELDAGRFRSAYESLNRAYTLDRFNATTVSGGALDIARCRIDPATCRARAPGARPAGPKP